MAELFSGDWMRAFMDAWNRDAELSADLARIGFSSVIGYGFDAEEHPRAVLVVDSGRATSVAAFAGQTLNWDLRATAEQWQAWKSKPPSLMGLGLAYTQRKLRFKQGDYAAMVKDPRLAGPFVRSFEVMARV